MSVTWDAVRAELARKEEAGDPTPVEYEGWLFYPRCSSKEEYPFTDGLIYEAFDGEGS